MLESEVGGGGDVCFERVSFRASSGTVRFVTFGERGPRSVGGGFSWSGHRVGEVQARDSWAVVGGGVEKESQRNRAR